MTVLVPPPSVLRPELRQPLLHFVQAAVALLAQDEAGGVEVPFVIDERPAAAGPALYAYRPLYRAYLDERTEPIRALGDYRRALGALAADPGAVAYARAHVESGSDEDALRGAILWPLCMGVIERQSGFDFSDTAFDAVYGTVERNVVGTRHRFEAFAPVTGLLVSSPPVDLGSGIVLRRVEPGDIAQGWPETAGLLPLGFGAEPDRRLALELTASLDRSLGEEPPHAEALLASAVCALRLVSGGPIAAGPLVFERLDLAPRAVRPLPSSASIAPRGEPVRLDEHRLAVARALLLRLRAHGERAAGPLGAALARWEVAQAARAPAERAAATLAALAPVLAPDSAGDHALALRAGALCGKSADERVRIAGTVRAAAALAAGANVPDEESAERLADGLEEVGRSTLVAALLDDRAGVGFAAMLDEVLLGARPRPQLVPDGLAVAAA